MGEPRQTRPAGLDTVDRALQHAERVRVAGRALLMWRWVTAVELADKCAEKLQVRSRWRVLCWDAGGRSVEMQAGASPLGFRFYWCCHPAAGPSSWTQQLPAAGFWTQQLGPEAGPSSLLGIRFGLN